MSNSLGAAGGFCTGKEEIVDHQVSENCLF